MTVNASAWSTTGAPEAIVTTLELWQMYEHLLDNPDLRFIQIRSRPMPPSTRRGEGVPHEIATQGFFTIVDKRFYLELSKRVWYAQYSSDTELLYVISIDKQTKKTIYLHREIMRLAGTLSGMIDHVNGDTLDNRLSNLETSTNSKNQQKADRRKRLSATGFEGVWKRGKSFEVGFKYGGVQESVGTFRTAADGEKARSQAIALKSTQIRKLSAHNRARLTDLRKVTKDMRERKLELVLVRLRPLEIDTAA